MLTASQNGSVLSFNSSIQGSNRKFACPGEVVTYHCVTYGTQLEWEIDNHPIAFGRNDTALNDGQKYRHTDEKTYWAILNAINPGTNESQTDDIVYRHCHSMLIVSPGQLSEDLTLSECGQCSPSEIKCSAIGNVTDERPPLTHQIAGTCMIARINNYY